MDIKEKILLFIKTKGPVLPRDISKEFQINSTLAGAYLSEFVSTKKIFYSNAKVGASPLYFLDSQKQSIADKLYGYLNEKDRQAFDLLKTNEILIDDDQTPLIKVALRNIKDFAVPINVNLASGKILYWKWYMISNEQVENILKQRYADEEAKNLRKEEKIEETEINATGIFEGCESQELKGEVQALSAVPETSAVSKRFNSGDSESDNSESIMTKSSENKSENVESRKNLKINLKQFTKFTKNTKTTVPIKEKVLSGDLESDTVLSEFDNSTIEERIAFENDEFFISVKDYFLSKRAAIKSYEITKKKSEIDLVIAVKTPLGSLDFYCKAKNKKRSNEGDLSTAFVQGQLRKLPVIFLTSGNLTKKAQEIHATNFKNMILNKLEVVK